MGMLPGAVEIELTWPIQVDGAELKTITMRRPKARDLLTLAERDEPDAEAKMLADLCEHTLETLLDLDAEDYLKVKETYIGFLPKSLPWLPKDSES